MFVNNLEIGLELEHGTILEEMNVMCKGAGLTCVSEDIPFILPPPWAAWESRME